MGLMIIITKCYVFSTVAYWTIFVLFNETVKVNIWLCMSIRRQYLVLGFTRITLYPSCIRYFGTRFARLTHTTEPDYYTILLRLFWVAKLSQFCPAFHRSRCDITPLLGFHVNKKDLRSNYFIQL
jgi:hypothetical protein